MDHSAPKTRTHRHDGVCGRLWSRQFCSLAASDRCFESLRETLFGAHTGGQRARQREAGQDNRRADSPLLDLTSTANRRAGDVNPDLVYKYTD